MNKKPPLAFWQLWNMSFGYVGIQFGFALQNANVSRIFETLGAKVENIPILWIAAPISGLLIQPIIGHLSDKTWNRLGRRKPYFLLGAILSSLALLFMPNSPALWVAAGMLWIMDASINVTMQPFRAFIGDMLPEGQRTSGFAMQTFFIGISSVVASICPWLFANWLHLANTAPAGEIPPSVKWSFYVGGVAFLATVLWTVFKVREYTPEELESFGSKNDESSGETSLNTRQCMVEGIVLVLLGLAFSWVVGAQEWYQGLYILSFGLAFYGALQIIAALRAYAGKTTGMVEIVADLKTMPATMKQLALVTILTWFALFAMFIYSTPAVTSFHFHSSDPTSALYNDGANWVGVLMAVYNGVAALVAFLLPPLTRKIGRVTTHVVCLLIGGAGLLSMYLFTDPTYLLISMTAIGIAWASLLTIPYAILSSAVSHKKMGVYMGMFNLFLVIPQILAAAILGLLVQKFFHGAAIYAIALGGIAMVLAGILMAFVKDGEAA
ncbi:maltose/moltooligosaccharide transporter [Rhizomicrobium palustre]|uniref:Maltose/moltooligosaccharide transporter n=1 Tax=Rhizomicrobium palustre TaxID=189966 RepID=A0A846N149_9PROT|nr:MFS transporter [Rhizomicrobium palustre]NIK88887.1 maltose/moltooligosaccharide transporter [Rhizomicrobium palustre]